MRSSAGVSDDIYSNTSLLSFFPSIRSASAREERLSESFSRFHRRLGQDKLRVEQFSLAGLPVPGSGPKPGSKAEGMPSLKQLYDHRYFWRSDNARFWYYQVRKKLLSPTFASKLSLNLLCMLPQEVDPPRTKYSKKRQKQQQQKQQHENATVTVKSLGAVLITDTGV